MAGMLDEGIAEMVATGILEMGILEMGATVLVAGCHRPRSPRSWVPPIATNTSFNSQPGRRTPQRTGLLANPTRKFLSPFSCTQIPTW